MPENMAWEEQTRRKEEHYSTDLNLTSQDHPGGRHFPLDETNIETDCAVDGSIVDNFQAMGINNTVAGQNTTVDAVQETERSRGQHFRKVGGISVEETGSPKSHHPAYKYSESVGATGYRPHVQESSGSQPNLHSSPGYGPNIQYTNYSSTSHRMPGHSTSYNTSHPHIPHMPGFFSSGSGSGGGAGAAVYNIQGPVQIGSNNQIIYHGGSRPASSSSQKKPKQVKVTGSKRPVNSSDLDKVEKHIGSKWRKIGRKLGLDDAELDGINHDYHLDGLQEKAHQVLRHWVDSNGDDATLTKLARTLAEVGLYDIATSLK